MCEVATGFRPAFLFSSGCPCANVERTPGATYMSATGKIGTLHRHPHAAPQALAPAALACMGVVFGDIGTSPLYTVSVTLKASSSGGTVAPEAVLGIVSLIFWSLIVVISIKYALLIMRADNHGEGGILALLALISPRRARQSRRRSVMVVIGLLGATLLYGDGAITPAISVLSAIEGLKVYAPQTEHVIVPLTVATWFCCLWSSARAPRSSAAFSGR